MPHTRRALLAAVAAGLAGCSTGPGSDGGSDPTTTASRTTTAAGTTTSDVETPTTTRRRDTPDADGTTTDAGAAATATVELDVAAAFGSYFFRRGPELLAVAGGGEQYLLADVAVSGGTAPAGEFAVESGGAAYPMTYEPRGAAPEAGAFDRGAHYREGRSGWLAAALPPSLPAAPAVTFRERSWSVPDGPARRLTDRAPSFTVTSFETPGQVRPGASYSVRLTVRNDGGAGTFRAALNWAGERTVATVEQELPAGGRLRWQGGTDVPPGDATAMALVTAGETVERGVTVER